MAFSAVENIVHRSLGGVLPVRVLEEALNSRIGDESGFCDFHDCIITQEKEREQEKEENAMHHAPAPREMVA